MEHSPVALSTLSLLLGIEPAPASDGRRPRAGPDETSAFGAVLAAFAAAPDGERLPVTGNILPLQGMSPDERAHPLFARTDGGALALPGLGRGAFAAPRLQGDGELALPLPGAQSATAASTSARAASTGDPAAISASGTSFPATSASTSAASAATALPAAPVDAALVEHHEPAGSLARRDAPLEASPPSALSAAARAGSDGADARTDGSRPPVPAPDGELRRLTTAAEARAGAGDADNVARAASNAVPRTSTLEPTAASASAAMAADAAEPAADARRALNAPETLAEPRPGTRGAGGDLGESVADRIRVLVDHGRGEARLRLNPPELGSIDVRISVVDDKTFVQLTASHAAGRDAIEQTLPRLRELLSAGGLDLGGTSVDGGADRGRASPGTGRADGVERENVPDTPAALAAQTGHDRATGSGSIDIYA